MAYVGKWKLTYSQNYNSYLRAVGVNRANRKVANNVTPFMAKISEKDGYITITTRSPIVNTDIKFKFGEEFDEITGDGRKSKSTITLEDENKFVHKQIINGKSFITTREFNEDIMEMILDSGTGVICKRIYTRKDESSRSSSRNRSRRSSIMSLFMGNDNETEEKLEELSQKHAVAMTELREEHGQRIQKLNEIIDDQKVEIEKLKAQLNK